MRYISLDADGQRVLKLHKELSEVIKKPNRDELRSLLIDIYCSLFNTSKQDGYLYQREKGAKLDFLFHIPFKKIHEINNNDIEEKVRPQYTLTECLEMSVIRAYQQYNQIKKLKYLEDDELDINELPSGNELLASNYKFNTFSKTILMLDKFDRRSRFTKSTRISKHFDRPLYNSNYHLNHQIIIEAIEIINRAYTDLNIPLPDNFVEKCNESINNNVRKIMNQTNKLIMPCDQCERNDETVSYYYDEEHDLLIDCKLCEECSLNYQTNKNEIDKNPEEYRKLIDDALNSLETKSINFLKAVTDKVGKTCKIYLVTIGGTSFKDVDYSGFTSTMVRIPTHVLLLAVFFKFNLNVKPFTHYYKYKKWSDMIRNGKRIRFTTLFKNTTIGEALYLETLSIRTRRSKRSTNVSRSSNILPADHQPKDSEIFYLLKAIHQNFKEAVEKEDYLEIDENRLKAIDLSLIEEKLKVKNLSPNELHFFIFENILKLWNFDEEMM